MKKSADVLIVCTGFVGSNILSNHNFSHLYGSKNIKYTFGENYDLIGGNNGYLYMRESILQDIKDFVIKGSDVYIHLHISEPYLKTIERRAIRSQLAYGLKACNYSRFVSIEMAKLENVNFVMDTIQYVQSIFG